MWKLSCRGSKCRKCGLMKARCVSGIQCFKWGVSQANRAPGVLFHRYNEYSRREIWKGGLKGDIRGHAATSERATATRSAPCINSQHHQRDTNSHSLEGCAPKPPHAPPDALNDIIADTVHHRYTAAPFGHDYICNYLHNQLCIYYRPCYSSYLRSLPSASSQIFITTTHLHNNYCYLFFHLLPQLSTQPSNTTTHFKNCFLYYYILLPLPFNSSPALLPPLPPYLFFMSIIAHFHNCYHCLISPSTSPTASPQPFITTLLVLSTMNTSSRTHQWVIDHIKQHSNPVPTSTTKSLIQASNERL